MRSVSKVVVLGVAVLAAASCKAQEKTPPPRAPAGGQASGSLQGAADWRERMQKNHDAEQSIEQQVSRLTRDLQLLPAQQEKVRQLAHVHNDRIQQILDTAPPTLTRADFTTQVHAISQQFHDSVNAILSPSQLELMKAMVHRLDTGQENRRAP
jgi:hypothetical protein